MGSECHHSLYPLVMTNSLLLKMAMLMELSHETMVFFHSSVSLQEGSCCSCDMDMGIKLLNVIYKLV